MKRLQPEAGFSAGWLQLREPFDATARSKAAPRLGLEARLASWRRGAGGPLRVVDLGCGTGANLRWLAPRLGGAQQWMVVDHDAALLRHWPIALASASPAAPGLPVPFQGRSLDRPLQFRGLGFHADIVRRRVDLAEALETLPWPDVQLVTGSALLDLPGSDWLDRLAAATARAGAALLMALSVDGRHRWSTVDVDDDAVGALFAAHQQRDKGFAGPALGPAGAPALARALRRCGYRVHSARSDWVLDGASRSVSESSSALGLQRALIDGIAGAAVEQSGASEVRVRAWQQRRQALAARTVLRVGHIDLVAFPPAQPLVAGQAGDPLLLDTALRSRSHN